MQSHSYSVTKSVHQLVGEKLAGAEKQRLGVLQLAGYWKRKKQETAEEAKVQPGQGQQAHVEREKMCSPLQGASLSLFKATFLPLPDSCTQ